MLFKSKAYSTAYLDLLSGLEAVDNVLSFAKATSGKPSAAEQSLFVASVALSYAVWENYVEELALETAQKLSSSIDPPRVPDSVRDAILHRQPAPTAWDLNVHPGWRALWVDTVTVRAKGSDNQRDFGLLTADVRGVRRLFELVGLDPFADTSEDVLEKLDKLVGERGQIVHTGKAPPNFRKRNATAWRTFVLSLVEQVDGTVLRGTRDLVIGPGS